MAACLYVVSTPALDLISSYDDVANVRAELQRATAARIGATTITFDEASHAGGYTHYATRFATTSTGQRGRREPWDGRAATEASRCPSLSLPASWNRNPV
jgi:hypothetical protein